MNINYLTTSESLRSTIQDDPPIYEWFLHLIYQKKFRSDFSINPARKELYQKFGLQRVLQKCIIFLLCVNLTLFVLLKLYWLFGIAVLCMIVQYFVAKRLRKYVAEISLQKVNDDFPVDQLAQTTLYQIGEFYSEKYSTYSIVDLLAISHEYLRTLLICMVLAFMIVYPFINISKIILVVAILFLVFKIILNKSFIYNIRKKL